MTQKLYYQHPDITEFSAEIIETAPTAKGWRVILDKTYFYPEGGGQPADKGRIDNIQVIDVQKEGATIFHYLAEKPPAGAVKAKIDAAWRRDFMQQHTGQHIISGALWKIGEYKTVSVHLGNDYTTIEIDAPALPAAHLIETENLANRVIMDNLPLHFIETSHRELDKFSLRKPTNAAGLIRLVMIGDFDCAACGGLHLATSGAVRLVKAVGVEKIRGNTRLAWKIGDRAYADYRKKDDIIAALRPILAANEEMFVQKITGIQEETAHWKKKAGSCENRLAEIIAAELYAAAQVQDETAYRIITHSRQAEDEELMKKIIKVLLEKEKVLFCFVNVFADKLLWSIGCSADVRFSFDEIKKEILAVIDGKGGGRFPLWQGSGTKPQQADIFLSRFAALKSSLIPAK
ncbi:MAG: alanine--tRNA ligase-related protein [Candidatus Aminicenantes bacterium]|nr:alanine--tRNA ligase-related protein [Candidatus Aminicenantes bacterium]